jgi:hypothetical protein
MQDLNESFVPLSGTWTRKNIAEAIAGTLITLCDEFDEGVEFAMPDRATEVEPRVAAQALTDDVATHIVPLLTAELCQEYVESAYEAQQDSLNEQEERRNARYLARFGFITDALYQQAFNGKGR